MPKAKSRKPPKTQSVLAETKPRKFKKKQYKSFRLSKRIPYEGPPLPKARVLVGKSYLIWKTNYTLFGGVMIVYGLLQLLLVQGVLKSNFSQVKTATEELFGNQWHGLAGGLTSFGYLLSSIGQTSSSDSTIYQSMLLVIGSLALIWMLRQVSAGAAPRVRDAYYKGMYPLVPFLLVLIVISLQLIPLALGAWLYSTVVSNGIAVSAVEYVFWFTVFGLFAVLSFYMICSSIFALYISTLPDMTPMKALRSARGLVLHRRGVVARKLLFLVVFTILVISIIMIPAILIVPAIVPVLFYVVNVLAIGFAHTYIYSLYRELLNE